MLDEQLLEVLLDMQMAGRYALCHVLKDCFKDTHQHESI